MAHTFRVCLILMVLLLATSAAYARPRFARAEGKPCAYCHVNASGGGARNYRGIFYKTNSLSFAGFDDGAEAKKAGVPVGPEPIPPPKSYTPPEAVEPLPPDTPNPQSVPDFGTATFRGIEFVKIPTGDYVRGTTDEARKLLEKANEWTRMNGDEQPARLVHITKPFFISKYEVTQAQYRRFTKGGKVQRNPSVFKGDKLPVETVDWNDAQTFCRSLSQASSDRVKFRLPTEAEWEYVARAGSGGTNLYGMGADKGNVTAQTLLNTAWYSVNAGNKTHPVGTKGANAWGVYDLLGNVWEWCQDAYSPTFYADGPDTNPVCTLPPSLSAERVLRGGCWFLDGRAQRVNLRGGALPNVKSQYFGFRVVREL